MIFKGGWRGGRQSFCLAQQECIKTRKRKGAVLNSSDVPGVTCSPFFGAAKAANVGC